VFHVHKLTTTRLSVASFLGAWVSHVQKSRQPKTYELYEALIRNHVVPYIGCQRVASLEPGHVRSLLDFLSDKVGQRTRQLVYRVMRSAFSEAVEDGLLVRNPCARRDKPRYYPRPHKALDQTEAHALLKAAKATDYYALFFLAVVTGMRQGEIFGLCWDAVDFESAAIYVRGTLTRSPSGEIRLIPPKAARQRRVDVGPKLLDLLRRLRKRPGPWVFTDRKGEPLAKDRFVRTVFHPLLKAAGLPRIRFHDLRHTCATLGLASGVNVKVMSERLGHSSAKMTLDVYTKALPTLQRQAATTMETIVGEVKRRPRVARSHSAKSV
jgi:integrase